MAYSGRMLYLQCALLFFDDIGRLRVHATAVLF